jgi:RND family efflux transporter MFP subunit
MKTWLKFALPALILIAGAAAAAGFVKMKPQAKRGAPVAAEPAVHVLTVAPTTVRAKVHGTGTVRAAREVQMAPEVAGRVVFQSDKLVPGGRFRAGETLLRLDDRDYAIAIRQQESLVEKAELDMKVELSRQGIASKEWELLGDDRPQEQAHLALRKPHLAAAQRGLDSAKSGLERAQLQLERTRLKAPFNAIVLNETVEQGQYLGPGTRVATLVGTDEFWVTVSLPVERLPGIELPEGDKPGSSATIIQELGNQGTIERTGKVLRLSGQLDPQTRTAQLLVAVPKPLDGESAVPLLPGSFVRVDIEGRELSEVYEVPRAALVDGDTLWVVDGKSRLLRRKVVLAWRFEASGVVYVSEGLVPGDRVVTTPLALPIDGMKVRVVAEEKSNAAGEPTGAAPNAGAPDAEASDG